MPAESPPSQMNSTNGSSNADRSTRQGGQIMPEAGEAALSLTVPQSQPAFAADDLSTGDPRELSSTDLDPNSQHPHHLNHTSATHSHLSIQSCDNITGEKSVTDLQEMVRIGAGLSRNVRSPDGLACLNFNPRSYACMCRFNLCQVLDSGCDHLLCNWLTLPLNEQSASRHHLCCISYQGR